ncbi:MAG TPA: hypothetical protein VL443_24030 [Cyclobacteriaceae bacterium]|jgi:hypothetical protein|nr:hypothetical protein [Cyclobacteriaceae bacterium]
MKTTFINPSSSKAERRQVRQFAIEALQQRQTNFEKLMAPDQYGDIINVKMKDDHGEFYLYKFDGYSKTESQSIKFYVQDDEVVIKFLYMLKLSGCYLDITKKDWAQLLFRLVKIEIKNWSAPAKT